MAIQSDYWVNPHIWFDMNLSTYVIVHSAVFCLEIYFSHTEKRSNKIITLTLSQRDTH